MSTGKVPDMFSAAGNLCPLGHEQELLKDQVPDIGEQGIQHSTKIKYLQLELGYLTQS